jgi:hypothetical protein
MKDHITTVVHCISWFVKLWPQFTTHKQTHTLTLTYIFISASHLPRNISGKFQLHSTRSPLVECEAQSRKFKYSVNLKKMPD